MIGKIYIFAGGGTGGHLYPGLAVASELKRIDGDARVVFACSDREVDRRILGPTAYAFVPQPIRPLPKGIIQVPGFLWAWVRSGSLARRLIGDLCPAGVLGLGGFAAAPVVKVASRAGVRTAMLNPDAVVGRANQYLAGRVDAIFTQFESTALTLGSAASAKVRCVGCPIRRELLDASRDEAIQYFELLSDRKTLLIFGGSTMARSINEAAAEIAPELGSLGDKWQILHVSGPADTGQIAGAYEGKIHARTLEYCDRMDLAYAVADLVLSRGGASTVAELTATATPAIILPYPHHRDEQQKLNAARIVSGGAGICVTDASNVAANAVSLRATLIPLMADPDRLESMHHAAAALRKSDAAEKVARWLVE